MLLFAHPSRSTCTCQHETKSAKDNTAVQVLPCRSLCCIHQSTTHCLLAAQLSFEHIIFTGTNMLGPLHDTYENEFILLIKVLRNTSYIRSTSIYVQYPNIHKSHERHKSITSCNIISTQTLRKSRNCKSIILRCIHLLMYLPVVVALHLVVKDLALLRGGVRDQLSFDDLEDVVADVRKFRLDLRLVVPDQRQLVALRRDGRGYSGKRAEKTKPTSRNVTSREQAAHKTGYDGFG